MAGRWYCKISGQTSDPLSPGQLKALADQGELGPNDLVRHGDEGPWIPAVCVKGLMSAEGSSESLPEATAKPVAETARRGPAKYSGKRGARPAAPRKTKSLPVARPMDDPPAARESGKVRPAAPKPAPARPAASAAPLGPLVVNPVTESATHRALGRTVASPRRRQRNNLLAVAVLSVMAVGLGIAGVVVLSSRNAADDTSADDKTAAKASGKKDGQQPAKQPETAAEGPGSGSPDSPKPRSPEDGTWVDASRSAIHRDKVRVQVLSARIGTPPGEAAVTRGEFLLIAIQVQNTNSDKDLRFTSWNSPVPLDVPVRLTDQTGRVYRQRFRPGDKQEMGEKEEERKKREDSGKPAPAIGSNAAGNVLGVSEQSFDSEVLRAPGLVLVNFFSPECAHCQRYLPLVRQVAADNAGSVKVATVDVQQNVNLGGRYARAGVPMVVVFQHGEVVEQMPGIGAKSLVQEAIDRHSQLAGRVYQPLPAAGTVEEVLVFDAPGDDVKYLRLSLPAAAFGSEGTLNFIIPGSMIDKGEQRKPSRDPFASDPKKPAKPSAKTPGPGKTPAEQPELPEEKVDPWEREGEKVMEEINKGADDKEGEGFGSTIKKPSEPDPKKRDKKGKAARRPGSKDAEDEPPAKSRPTPGDRDREEEDPFK